jgi:pimeloyl-ACP methyl ester carboxylesterase
MPLFALTLVPLMSLQSQPLPIPTGAPAEGDSAWLKIDWREHRRWITVGERRVNCVELGSGPAVLLIHGLGGNWQNWLENIPHLARNHRVIAIDLPGFGESEMPHEQITIAFYARWIAQLLGTLEIERCAVIGNSMGGQIAAEFTLLYPEIVERLVLVSAAGISVENFNKPSTVKLFKRADRLFAFWSTQVVARGRQLTRRRRARRALMSFWVRRPDDLSAALVVELSRGTGKPGFAAALKGLTNHALRARLRQIKAPVLLVWGAEDRITPLRDANEFHDAIRDSQLVVYDDTAHLSMLERPVEFNELMDEFLEG